jgi:hypothetical protein
MRVCCLKTQSARIYVTKEQLITRRAVAEALILFNRNAMVKSTKGGPVRRILRCPRPSYLWSHGARHNGGGHNGVLRGHLTFLGAKASCVMSRGGRHGVQRPKIIAPPRTSSKHLSTLAPAGRIRTRLAAWRDPPGLGHQALDVAGSGSSRDDVFDQAERPDGVGAGGLDHGRDGGDRHWRELQGAAEARRRVPGVAQRIERQNRGPAGVETLENSLRSFDQLSESEADLNQQLR